LLCHGSTSVTAVRSGCKECQPISPRRQSSAQYALHALHVRVASCAICLRSSHRWHASACQAFRVQRAGNQAFASRSRRHVGCTRRHIACTGRHVACTSVKGRMRQGLQLSSGAARSSGTASARGPHCAFGTLDVAEAYLVPRANGVRPRARDGRAEPRPTADCAARIPDCTFACAFCVLAWSGGRGVARRGAART
jgi:hypothetical protein